MRWWLVMLVLTGCQYYAATTVGQPIENAIKRAIRQEEEARRAEFEREIQARANALIATALKASAAGDCTEVSAIGQQVRALPPPYQDPDALHDQFLAEPALRPCLQQAECQRARHWVATYPELADDEYMRNRVQTACNPPLPRPVVVVETVAARPAPPPRVPRAPCANARAAAYDESTLEAPTGRLVALGLLPTCPVNAPGEQADEQVWQWTIVAATSALRGSCAFAMDYDEHVKQRDPDHYSRRWSQDPAIAQCQRELAASRVDRERCLHERGAALRRAQTITDLERRGEVLTSIPQCPPAR